MVGILTDITAERVTRKKELLEKIKENYPDHDGVFLLCSGFENDREPFYQESSFEYFVGIQEPAAILYQPLHDSGKLYLPNYSVERSAWLPTTFDEMQLSMLGIDSVEVMGKKVNGYSTGPFHTKEALSFLIAKIEEQINNGKKIFTLLSDCSNETKIVIDQLCKFIPPLKDNLIDVAPLVAELRRTKSQYEIECLYHAIEITAMAHQAAAGVIKKGNRESDVQAAIEYIFTESGAVKAFSSIVGSGKNSTILHYVDNQDLLKSGDLVVVDIGASFNHYCGDITRTYPVSGQYTDRQKKVYEDVLATQKFIFEKAKPGVYLNNKNKPEESLNHLAKKFVADLGYDPDKDFPHGIGHYVGLDVHDVGTYETPLAEGDIITIEPGIYLRDENLGVRIEDMCWIVSDGAVCLSEEIPKKIVDIERFMRESRLTDDEDSDSHSKQDVH